MEKNIRNRLIIGLVAMLVAPALAWAQPAIDGFNKGKGNLDLVGGYTFEAYGQYYAHGGLTSISRATNVVSFFAATGVTDRLDVQVNVPFIFTQPDLSGLQDLAVFAKYSWIKKSTEGKHFTLGTAFGYSTPMTVYETESLFSIGQRATAFDARLYGQYMWSNGFFFMGQAGYTHRLDPVPSSIPAAIKVGSAKAKYYWDVWVDFQYALEGNDYLDGSNSSFRTFGVSYIKIGGTYYKPLKSGKTGLALGAFFVPYGRNIGQAFGVSAAYIFKLKYGQN